jgi:hypothetical protein
MNKTVPWHSTAERIYHNNTRCKLGMAIAADARREGSGGKRLCPECERLNAGRSAKPDKQ